MARRREARWYILIFRVPNMKYFLLLLPMASLMLLSWE